MWDRRSGQIRRAYGKGNSYAPAKLTTGETKALPNLGPGFSTSLHESMAEALKELFNRSYFERLAQETRAVLPRFDHNAFLRDVLLGNEDRQLNARMRHASTTLRSYLPADVPKAVEVLKDLAPRMPRGYTAIIYPDFVAQYGLEDPTLSLEALKYFTPFGTSEFAVREFLRRDMKGTLRVMSGWAEDDNEHVRRLASEGSRPRLPWSFRLGAAVQDPTLTAPILHLLRQDASLYVRKSVANHLNDVSKDHPEYVVGLLRKWDRENPHTAWIAKHASRTLIKAGNASALALFSFGHAVAAQIRDFTLTPNQLRLGETLCVSFTVVSQATKAQLLAIDYAIHYVKADGRTTKKVFKLKEIKLGAGAATALTKKQRIVDFSTRKHYPGEHALELVVNGNVMARSVFQLAR
jgi:3-methyladenine DNA glycosylase AlkC